MFVNLPGCACRIFGVGRLLGHFVRPNTIAVSRGFVDGTARVRLHMCVATLSHFFNPRIASFANVVLHQLDPVKK